MGIWAPKTMNIFFGSILVLSVKAQMMASDPAWSSSLQTGFQHFLLGLFRICELIRLAKWGWNWHEGPVSQDQTGLKCQKSSIKLARRASKISPNWPEGPYIRKPKFEVEIRGQTRNRSQNSKSKSKLEIEVKTRNRSQNSKSKSKLKIET